MWAFGVILYILLGGYQPFHASDDKKLNRLVINGKYEFHNEYWSNISQEAKDLIRGMLTVNPHKRLTVQQALAHPWMNVELKNENLNANLEKLKNYQARSRWKTGIRTVLMLNRLNVTADGLKELPHTVNDRYEIGEKIGEGGFSVVKKGTSRVDQLPVAIKIVSKSKLSKSDELCLRQEVQILQELDHPNIIRCFDFFEEDAKNFHVVLEYVDGGELFDRIVQKTAFSEKEAMDTVYTILSAIKFLHDSDIVHR